MGKDLEGVTTREDILSVSKRLFYENGYRNTSFQDICREAHVYRGTIYYYYKEKGALRLEVLQDHFNGCLLFAQKYCADKSLAAMLAHYIQLHKFLNDPKVRRFITEYFTDEPVYCHGKGLSVFYSSIFETTFAPIVQSKDVSCLSIASVYGYIAGMVRLINAYPASYTAGELFFECLTSITRIWNVDGRQLKKMRNALEACIQFLPEKEIALIPF